MELNPEKDIEINVARLDEEFTRLPLLLFRYSEARAESGEQADLAEARYKEARSKCYVEIVRNADKKPSDKAIEAEIDTNPEVLELKREYYKVKRDFETIKGFVESLRAKKDMLIQCGSDRRKEL